jgi:WD repeat-containing protein 42A
MLPRLQQLRARELQGSRVGTPLCTPAPAAAAAATRSLPPLDPASLACAALLLGHGGCVNAAAWLPDGQHALTGSDDTRINVYATRGPPRALRRPLLSLPSGHTNNIFCVRSLAPSLHCGGVARLASCAADGQVRLHTLALQGGGRAHSAVVLSRHDSRAHRLAVPPCSAASTHTFASCGEDGAVRFYDTRAGAGPKCETAAFTQRTSRGAALRLFSLEYRPGHASQLATGGSDAVARLWDVRCLRQAPLQLLPARLQGSGSGSAAGEGAVATCVTFSRDGARLAVALNDLSTHVMHVEGGGSGSGGDEVAWGQEGQRGSTVRVLQGAGKEARDLAAPVVSGGGGGGSWAGWGEGEEGEGGALPWRPRQGGARASIECSAHENMQTIKGCSFFGAGSEFLLQGSDCGRLFLYCSRTGAVRGAWKADGIGAVNVCAPHPDASVPEFLTAGLESTTKLWGPSDLEEEEEEEEEGEEEGGEGEGDSEDADDDEEDSEGEEEEGEAEEDELEEDDSEEEEEEEEEEAEEEDKGNE